MPRPPSEPRASRSITERIASSLIVGPAPQSDTVLVKFRFIRGATETIQLERAVAAALLDGLTAAESQMAALWDAAGGLNENAERLLTVAFPRFTDEDSELPRIGKAIDMRLGVADSGAIVEFALSDGSSRIVGFTPTVARHLRGQLQGLQAAVPAPGGDLEPQP
jgi:hypothetical protein